MKWYFGSEFRLKAGDISAKVTLGSGMSEAQKLLDPEMRAAARLTPMQQWYKKMVDEPDEEDGTHRAGLMSGGDDRKTATYTAAYKTYLASNSPTNKSLANKDLQHLNGATGDNGRATRYMNILRREFGGKDVQEDVYSPTVSCECGEGVFRDLRDLGDFVLHDLSKLHLCVASAFVSTGANQPSTLHDP